MKTCHWKTQSSRGEYKDSGLDWTIWKIKVVNAIFCSTTYQRKDRMKPGLTVKELCMKLSERAVHEVIRDKLKISTDLLISCAY